MNSGGIFLIVWAVAIVTIWPSWIYFAVRSRRRRGASIFPRPPAAARFCETRASGWEEGRVGGASRCLLVAVTEEAFWITPTFPFLLVAPYGVLGLEHCLPRKAVSAELKRSFGGCNVRLKASAEGRLVVMRLRLREPDAFITALAN